MLLQFLNLGPVILAQASGDFGCGWRKRLAAFQHVLDEPSLPHDIRRAMKPARREPCHYIAGDFRHPEIRRLCVDRMHLLDADPRVRNRKPAYPDEIAYDV